jgi:hypothetical protein
MERMKCYNLSEVWSETSDIRILEGAVTSFYKYGISEKFS